MPKNIFDNEHLVFQWRAEFRLAYTENTKLTLQKLCLSRNWSPPTANIQDLTKCCHCHCESGMSQYGTGCTLTVPLIDGTDRLIDCIDDTVSDVSFGQCVFYESCGTGGTCVCRGEGGPATVPGATHDSSFKSPDVMEESCSGSTPLALLLSSSFFHFMRRFWNQILMCLSVRLRVSASSTRRGREMYLLKRNSFSSSSSWALV